MKQFAFNYFYNPQGSSPGTLTITDTATNTSINPFCLVMMSAIALILTVYFWRKGWLKNTAKLD